MNQTSFIAAARRIKFYHVAVTVVTALLLTVAVNQYYQFATQPTDENFYTTTPSNLYVAGTIVAQRETGPKSRLLPDSIQIGDLITIVGNERILNLVDFRAVLEKYRPDSTVVIRIVRPRLNAGFNYRVEAGKLNEGYFSALPPSAFVFDVFPGGASDRAGMKPGDIIIRVNKQYFENAWQADAIIRQAQAGKTIAYEVVRKNRILTLQVTLAELEVPFASLMMFFAGLLYFAVGYLMAIKSAGVSNARLPAFALILFGFVICSSFTRGNAAEELGEFFMLVFRIGSIILAIAMLTHARWYFPVPLPDHKLKRWLIRIPYGVALLGGLIALLLFNPAAVTVVIVVLVLLHFAVIFIIRPIEPPKYKIIQKALTIGISATVVAIPVFFFIADELMALPLAVFPLLYLFITARYRLLDIRLRLRKNVQYVVASSFWIVLAAAGALAVAGWVAGYNLELPPLRITSSGLEWSSQPLNPAEARYLDRLIILVLTVAFTLAFLYLFRRGRLLIDKRFYRAEHDYRRASNELTEVMASNLDLLDLSDGIVKKLASLMHLRSVGLVIFRDERSLLCTGVQGVPLEKWNLFCAENENLLIRELQHDHTDSRLSAGMMTSSLSEALGRIGIGQIVAIRSKDRLVGAMLLGDKMSDTAFNNDDYSFLSAVSRQASIAVENAFLYEDLAEQNRLKHELEIARRIQLNSLPQRTPDVPGLDIAGCSVPAQEVGGDYFDYYSAGPTHLMAIIGDVSGKGTSAALYMSKVQGILHSLHTFNLRPRDVFIRSNRILTEDLTKDSFVTSLGIEFDTKTRSARLARAGHMPLFHYSAKSGDINEVRPDGLGLGLVDNRVFEENLGEQILSYDKGDVFVLVTDGVTEARNESGGLFGEERVQEFIKNASSTTAIGLMTGLMDAVRSFTGKTLPHDDQTVVVIKIQD